QTHAGGAARPPRRGRRVRAPPRRRVLGAAVARPPAAPRHAGHGAARVRAAPKSRRHDGPRAEPAPGKDGRLDRPSQRGLRRRALAMVRRPEAEERAGRDRPQGGSPFSMSTRVGERSFLYQLRDGVLVGEGEASPLPGYSLETVEVCSAALERGRSTPAADFARFAARLDLDGKRQGRPAHSLLGATRARLPLASLVSSLADADNAWARGI